MHAATHMDRDVLRLLRLLHPHHRRPLGPLCCNCFNCCSSAFASAPNAASLHRRVRRGRGFPLNDPRATIRRFHGEELDGVRGDVSSRSLIRYQHVAEAIRLEPELAERHKPPMITEYYR